MSLADFPEQRDVVALLQRSLENGRLGHAYLFNGPYLAELEGVARALAKTLNCEKPLRRGPGKLPVDSCDGCLSCRKIDAEKHPDVLWVRPESKSRVITVDQMRDLMRSIYLRPTEAPFKVGVIVGADRLNVAAANAFLKTLEEPPADSILVLLSTEPQRLLETILSRCLRLNFAGETQRPRDPGLLAWLARFSEVASAEQRTLLSRYNLLSVLLERLNEIKEQITATLTARSPLERFDDVESKLKERWEEELEAAIESEYRRQRCDLLVGLQWWLRDVWLVTMRVGDDLLTYPQLADNARKLSGRLSPEAAVENLSLMEQTQWLLAGNVQEALALEVGLLKLKL
jgi:DNA polymerase-3 subunit delta'